MAKSNNNRQDHQFSGDANGEGNRKKRKRIGGKEKVDIEKSANQMLGEGRKGGDKKNGGDKNAPKRDKNQNKVKRPLKPEVSDEDVYR